MKKHLATVSMAINKISGALCALGALVSTLGVLWLIGSTGVHVVMRMLELGGVPGIVELNALVMVVVVFFAFGQAQRENVHVSVTVVVGLLPRTVVRYCMFLAIATSLAVVLWWFGATIPQFVSSQAIGERLTGVTDFTVWPVRLAIVVGLGILLLEILNQLILAIRGEKKKFVADTEESVSV